jgi:hypothetical protein
MRMSSFRGAYHVLLVERGEVSDRLSTDAHCGATLNATRFLILGISWSRRDMPFLSQLGVDPRQMKLGSPFGGYDRPASPTNSASVSGKLKRSMHISCRVPRSHCRNGPIERYPVSKQANNLLPDHSRPL